MRKVAAAGVALTLFAVAALVASIILALLGSRLAPTWLQSMALSFAGMTGVLLVVIGTVRDIQADATQSRVTWRTATAVPYEAGVAQRGALVLRPGPPLGVFAVAVVGFFALMTVFVAYPDARIRGALRRHGVETAGTVRGKRTYERKQTYYYIDYDYRVTGATIQRSANVSKGRWQTLKVGDPLRVTYSPRVPEISLPIARAALTLTDVVNPMFILLTFGAACAMLSMTLLSRRLRLRTERIWRDGEATLATVTAVSGPRVKYTFDAHGERITAVLLYNSAAVPKPAAGDSFVVIFNSARPNESLVFSVFAANSDGGNAPAAPSQAGVIDRELLAPSLPAGPARISWPFYGGLALVAAISLLPGLRLIRSLALRNVLDVVQREGIETDGVVTGTGTIHEWPEPSMRVRYRYGVGARPFIGVVTFDSGRFSSRFLAGAATSVTYAASDPHRSIPFAKRDLAELRIEAMFSIWFCVVMLAIFAAISALTILRTWRELRIARGGRLAIARVEAVDGFVFRRCRYRFVSDHGDVEDSVLLQSKTFRPAAGDRIEVLYASNPPRSIPAGDLLFVTRG
jgi:hypothetical protein